MTIITIEPSGFLRPLYPTTQRLDSKVVWKCLCTACGKPCFKTASDLRNKRVKSCGCRHYQNMGRGRNVEQEQKVVGLAQQGHPMTEIGRLLGLSKQRVYQIWKRATGHPAPSVVKRRSYTEDELRSVLGKVSDKVAAQSLGCTLNFVIDKRSELGIAAYRRAAGPKMSRIGQLVNGHEIIGCERIPNRGYGWYYRCKRCGRASKRPVSYGNLKRTQSCGCLLEEIYRRGGGWHWNSDNIPIPCHEGNIV